MSDIFDSKKRSEIMSHIRGKNTKPEIKVRSLLHKMGYRFRLHRHDLPGIPDICLPKYKTVIFVNGCYWHRHKDCKKGRSQPKTNIRSWQNKFKKTVARDNLNYRKLHDLGWNVVVVWECELKDTSSLATKLSQKIN